VGSVDSSRVLIACSFASVGFFGNTESSTQSHGSLLIKQPYYKAIPYGATKTKTKAFFGFCFCKKMALLIILQKQN
jgi:hypothetical protein